MRVHTKAYGDLDVDERQLVSFPEGLFGFEEMRDWVLLDAARPPFYWLQSMERVEVAFVLIDPRLLRADYEAGADPAELAALEIAETEEPLVLAIVTVPEDPSRMTVNLLGPLVINRRSRVGRQCISADPRWTVRHPLLEEATAAGTPAC
jgi:flagellar assembly factor FliW